MMTHRELPEELVKEFDIKWTDVGPALESAGLVFADDPVIRKSMKIVFALSDFVFKTCVRSPGMLIELIDSGDLVQSYNPGRFHEKLAELLILTKDENTLNRVLRRFRAREMVRTAWRDLCGWADLSETLADLSEFADACVSAALRHLFAWQCDETGIPENARGEAQGLVVLGMGKLGGRELNFSSDIDLVFAFPENGSTRGKKKSIGNGEFFTRLCQRLISVLGGASPEGNLFRVDMRLRPFGENGPLVMSFEAMEDYYQDQGREWERYAWLRARVIAGDGKAGENLLNRLTPFIYRRYLDYTVFEALREMKQQIARDIMYRNMADDVKLGPGGIREIEFFCQTFQILRGGVMPILQERHTPRLLELLKQEQCISPDACGELLEAWRFLRNTEHHIQEFSDAQTHAVPVDFPDRLRLCYSMGFETITSLEDALKKYRQTVQNHFNGLLTSHRQNLSAEDRLLSVWQHATVCQDSRAILTDAGYNQPDEVLHYLTDLKESPETRAMSPKGRERVDRLIPGLLAEAARSHQPELVIRRIVDLIKAIERRTSYIALLLENPPVLSHLINLAEKSPWIITFLARHPVVLDELLDPRTLYAPPERSALEKEIQDQLCGISDDDLEYQIETLCIFKQANLLRVAAADVTGALPIMRVSDHLTDIAETILDQVVGLCRRLLVKKHGAPVCAIQGAPCDNGFLIVGYGKLGGLELGYRSDLDLVFLHAGTPEKTRGNEHPIETPYFFSRLGQRIIHLLTTHTRAGVLYETDMRLRPSGSAGPLVIPIEAFYEYQKNDGWTWEKQALVRARPICGDASLAQRFGEIREDILSQPADEKKLQADVRDMRAKIMKERVKPAPGQFDLKEDKGGILDIEFLVQYLVLLNSHRHPQLTRWTDNVRILETLSENRVIEPITALVLKEAYLTFRAQVHRLNLQEKPSKVPLDQFQDLKEKVVEIFEKYLPGPDSPASAGEPA
jgi:[glutamine synthetase] adenylyltransferase / [glutamine synthetase]-adenylyl-L-tyrosine phosphorylase